MQIINYFDIKFILNLSISITISLFVVFVFGKAICDLLSEGLKFLLKRSGKSFLKKYAPIRFFVGFPLNRLSPVKFTYEKHRTINFGKLNQASLPATGMDIFIKTEAKFPFLYEGSKIIVQLVDSKDLLGVYNAQKLPSKPTTFLLGEFEFENNIVNHVHIDFQPKKTFENYNIPVNIFCQGKLHKNEVQLTIAKDKLIK